MLFKEEEIMGKLLFFLIFVLYISGTHQKEGKRRIEEQSDHSGLSQCNNTGLSQGNNTGLSQCNNSKASDSKKTGLSFLSFSKNNSNTTTQQLENNGTAGYLNSTLTTTVIPIIYMFVVAVGVPANVAILVTLATKVRKVSTAILYCSLAVSDLFLLLSLFFKAHYHFHGNDWVLGEAACRVVTACFYGNLYCSAQTLALISIHRYLAVVHPFMYKGLPKRMCTAWVSLAIWGVFGAAVVPELLFKQSYLFSELGRIICHDVLPLKESSHNFLLYYNLSLTIFGLLVPLVVTVVCYARIICELNRSHLDWKMYIKASSLVFVIFLVCFTPAGLLRFLHYLQLSVNRTDSLYMYFNVAVCLCCLHACLDPFLFIFMSKSSGSKPHLKPLRSKTLSTLI